MATPNTQKPELKIIKAKVPYQNQDCPFALFVPASRTDTLCNNRD